MNEFGLPDFESISAKELEAEITSLLRAHEELIAAVAADTEVPSVENLLEPFEKGRLDLERSCNILFTYASSVGGDEWDGAESRVIAALTAHEDATYQNSALYDRFVALDAADLDAETAWCVEQHLKAFRERGAQLDTDAKARLSEINLEMSKLTTLFGQLVVKGQLAGSVALTEDEVEGLSDAQKTALAADAAANPELADGKPYLVVLRLPTQQPVQSSLARADVRKKILDSSLARGDGHDQATDTRDLAIRLAKLRAEQAKILGFPNFSELVAARSTAGTREAIMGLLTPMVAPTQANVTADHEALVKAAHGEIAPADWLYTQERLSQELHQLDPAEVAPYFELNSVVENGVFYAANRLYGLIFHYREDLHGYADTVKIWEIHDADGTVLGLFMGDYYARTGKRGGAWMHDIQSRSAEGFNYVIVCNDLNLTKPAEGPTLLTWDEVNTAFHEFGHALHSMLTNVRWPSTAGTNVPRDFVEYPSQVNEIWAAHPEVIANYARHIETGEVLPEHLRTALTEAAGDGEGFHMSEMLQAVLLDQAWHSRVEADIPSDIDDVEAFEIRALERLGITNPWIAPRYRTGYFNHIFSGGYAAGYYSYLWSEALDADTVDWFQNVAAIDGDGGLNREAGAKMRAEVLSRGNSRNPIESFEALRGRPVDTTPLLRRHKLI